jgi:hypothetical protein
MSDQNRGELRRLIREFLSTSADDTLSVDVLTAHLLKSHRKLVEAEKLRLFRLALASIGRAVLRSPQLSQQMVFPDFPEELFMPNRILLRSSLRNGKPLWKSTTAITGAELAAKIAEMRKPRQKHRDLEALEFCMEKLASKIGKEEAEKTSRTVGEILGISKEKDEPA